MKSFAAISTFLKKRWTEIFTLIPIVGLLSIFIFYGKSEPSHRPEKLHWDNPKDEIVHYLRTCEPVIATELLSAALPLISEQEREYYARCLFYDCGRAEPIDALCFMRLCETRIKCEMRQKLVTERMKQDLKPVPPSWTDAEFDKEYKHALEPYKKMFAALHYWQVYHPEFQERFSVERFKGVKKDLDPLIQRMRDSQEAKKKKS